MPKKSKFDELRPKLGKELDQSIKIDKKPELSPFLYTISEEYKEDYEKKFVECSKKSSTIIVTSKLDRMFALMKIYSKKGVDINNPWALIVNIVNDFVPAFEVNEGIARGKKTEWTLSRLVELWDDVNTELESQSGQKSVLLACKKLLKREPYSNLKGIKTQKLSPEALENRYSEAKNSEICIFLERLKNNDKLSDSYKGFLAIFKQI
jgi:hypothetical protein